MAKKKRHIKKKNNKTKTMDLIFQIGQFKFFDENLQMENLQLTGKQMLNFQTYYYVESSEILGNNQILITFAYGLDVKPIMKITMGGSCILRTPVIKRFKWLLDNRMKEFITLVARPIIKKSYINLTKMLIVKGIRIPFPTLESYIRSLEDIGLLPRFGEKLQTIKRMRKKEFQTQCSVCGRKSVDPDTRLCLMTQPNGKKCQGKMIRMWPSRREKY